MVRISRRASSASGQSGDSVGFAGGRTNSALAAVLGAGAATLGAATEVSAAPTLVNQSGSITIDSLGNISSPNPLAFDLDGVPGLSGFPDVEFSATFGAPSQFNMLVQGAIVHGSPLYVSALSFGDLIPSTVGSGATMFRLANLTDLTTGTADGHFIGAPDPSFAGFYFEAANGDTLAAWAKLSVEFGNDSATLHIHGFGYESVPNQDILAGVPEPASAALAIMATGAAGVATRRRKNQLEPAGACKD
jgi:hypothetical protein